MDTELIFAAVVVILLIAAAVVWMAMSRRRSARLKSRFGPEYERAVEESPGRREAEAELRERRRRVESLTLKPLDAGERTRFSGEWRDIQAAFVDQPEGAVESAERLIDRVMEARGYPVGDFDQRAADLSVDHPVVVQNYREARDILGRHHRGDAGTEDLRQAMIHYRALFDELVVDGAESLRAAS